MRVKRISKVSTLRQYEAGLLELIPKYLAKSLDEDQPQDILRQIRLGCHAPCALNCVVLDDDDRLCGFCCAYILMDMKGKRLIIDHLYAPNLAMSVKIYDMLVEKSGMDDVWFITYRDPKGWERMSKKCRRPLALRGYVMRFVKED